MKLNVEGSQNVNVSRQLPLAKSLLEQLELMEKYTACYQANLQSSRARREAECLNVLFPALLKGPEANDLIAGRMDILPIGFGAVTSVGGVGHYCRFDQLHALQDQLDEQYEGRYHQRIQELYDFWLNHDVKTLFCKENLIENLVGPFIDPDYPVMATARLSGMMLDYPKLLELGIQGLEDLIGRRMEELDSCSLDQSRKPATKPAAQKVQAAKEKQAGLKEESQEKERIEKIEFYQGCLDCLKLYTRCALHLQKLVQEEMTRLGQNQPSRPITEALHDEKRLRQLETMAADLEVISKKPAQTFSQALQALWLYALLAGCINYGRLDDFLGPYLVRDLEAGRIDHSTDEETWKLAMDALASGATYPTIYNDEVNVPAAAWGMRVDERAAMRYVPFGCTEFVLWGQSTGTPNTLINLLKILTIYMNREIDPADGIYKAGPVPIPDLAGIESFDQFFDGYKKLVDYFMDLCAKEQMASYQVMASQACFVFNSILMDDCLERGKALLDGGVRYLGGTCETYGNINVSDSLEAIRHLVFETGKYTLEKIAQAVRENFAGEENQIIRKDCLQCAKYGNDLDSADSMANAVYEFVAKGIRQRGIDLGMQYFEIVISNNSLNTEWGQKTGASPDGRLKGMFMNPANNPQGGADKSGPTALLNSLSVFDARYHAGSVQNIKFSKAMFGQYQDLIEQMFKVYFDQGGCLIMVTVVDAGALEDAMIHPENYPDLIVRVAGYSAVFVDLDRSVQEELLSRTLYDQRQL